MTAFADLHRPGQPLLLPNAWDMASAAALVEAGFTAVGTTSLGVAAAFGLPDGARATRAETLDLATRMGGLPCLVSVDIEDGFSDEPAEVADLCAALADAGAVGVNLEDGLADPDRLAIIVRTVKRRVPGLFVNARTDTYWLTDHPSWTDTVDRVRRYRGEGADGIFVPGLTDPRLIAELAATVTLNILYQPGGPTLRQLAGYGVARVSTGSLLFRVGLGAAVDAARAVLDPSATPGGVPGYSRAQGFTRYRSGTAR